MPVSKNNNPPSRPSHQLARIAMLCAGFLALTASADGSPPADTVIFSGKTVSPWQLYIGSAVNWNKPFQAPETANKGSDEIVVRALQGESRQIGVQAHWSKGFAQVYLQADGSSNFRELADAGGALNLVIRVDRKPEKEVRLTMGCGFPCGGTLNPTELFKAVPEGQWFRAAFKLSCFSDAGTYMENVVAPLVLATDGAFEVSLADVRLVSDPPAESLVSCD